MEKEKIYEIGEFLYSNDSNIRPLRVIDYIGPTGVGSVVNLCNIEGIILNGKNIDLNVIPHYDALYGKNVEKIITENWWKIFYNLPQLKEIIILDDTGTRCTISDCPMLEKIIYEQEVGRPVKFEGVHSQITIEYKKGLLKLDEEVSGDKIHAIIGDDVNIVGTIRGGHVTLGKSVEKILFLKKAEIGVESGAIIKEYNLPTRIDFKSELPPIVEKISPGSITLAEIHVPSGSLENYKSHPQWGKAAVIIDADGNLIDNYNSKFKLRVKKAEKQRIKELENQSLKKKKEDLLESLLKLCMEILTEWNPKLIEKNDEQISVLITIENLSIEIRILWNVSKETLIEVKEKCNQIEKLLKI